MSFGESIATCFRKYADFKGRASRAEYWWFFLFYIVAALGLAWLITAIKNPAPVVLLLGLILPQIAAAVRRLHDTGKPGTWYLITLVPYIGPIWLIVLLAQKSEPGPNQYGASGQQLMYADPRVPPMPPADAAPLPSPPEAKDYGLGRT
jgi:uncharacterized membrane protein YhaH (DUF805 family)